ncbi:MAG: L-threonylcarbamoyladenylate synthase [Candidatus Diapherotrites archaeon]|nr:L-threonylcarbamoyladenylate synthase [Candidatus Diapherotrites archaeon]
MRTRIISHIEPEALELAVKILKKQGLVIFPTESSYGLGCLLNNQNGRRKIYKIKKRSQHKSLPVITGNVKIISKYAELTQEDKKLIKKFMPGPLSLLVKAKPKAPKEFQKNGIVFRVSSNAFARNLSLKTNQPIISTSANISSKPSAYTLSEVIRLFAGRVDLIVEAGNLKKRTASTIYDTKNKKVIRKGPVTEKEILNVIEK